MTVIVQDSFNRANTTSLGTTDTGQVWQSLNGSIGISSNQAYPAAPNTDQDTQMYVESGAANVKISLTFLTLGANEEEIYFRLVDANNYLRMARYQGDLYLQKCVAGTITTVTTIARYNAGDTVMISANGSAVIVSYNGVQKINTTITNFTTATKHGFGFWSSPTSRVDNFIVEDFNTGGTPVAITGIIATATADGIAPGVSTQQLASITGVIANASSDTLAPAVSTVSSVSTQVDTLAAALTADALDPNVSTDSTVTSPFGTSAADALAPNVGSFTNISVNAVIVSANADAVNPSVNTVSNIAIETLIADATAEALAAMVGSSASAQITAVIASATSDTLMPILSTTQGTLINSVAAELTIDAPSPAIQTDAIISAFIANVIATSMAPGINEDAIPKYNEVIQIVLNITRKQTSALDITQRKQSELKL